VTNSQVSHFPLSAYSYMYSTCTSIGDESGVDLIPPSIGDAERSRKLTAKVRQFLRARLVGVM